ncbi:hypothetical protein [Ferriphaselus sp. R-1]|uniref:hypothetical protein n=1 Tax=Ferriphaselus sp. R-1 TaxID=1485544 RepID=UPI000558B538|nr:hypothetical protein [Ferriphaselus sp. R-1]
MEYLLLLFATIAIAAWWLMIRAGRKTAVAPIQQSSLSEQELVRLQADFERRLAYDCDLPDSIHGRDAYMYWNLMRNWFDKLIAENRYDDEYAKKIRLDWCEYVQLLPRENTARFLALETNDEAKAQTYAQEAESASRSIELIQNAFAAAIGSEALEVLREIRSRDADAFDRSGRRPVAPTGHHYFPVSISPYIEECQPKPIYKVVP